MRTGHGHRYAYIGRARTNRLLRIHETTERRTDVQYFLRRFCCMRARPFSATKLLYAEISAIESKCQAWYTDASALPCEQPQPTIPKSGCR